jgi:hypothetical protein
MLPGVFGYPAQTVALIDWRRTSYQVDDILGDVFSILVPEVPLRVDYLQNVTTSQPALDAASMHFSRGNSENHVTSQNEQKPASNGPCYVVTFQGQDIKPGPQYPPPKPIECGPIGGCCYPFTSGESSLSINV